MSLIIDITTIKRWNRFPVGIVRTQLEFVRYACHKLPNTRYIYFSDDKSTILFEDLSNVKELLNKYDKGSWNSDNRTNTDSPVTQKTSFHHLGTAFNVFRMLKNKQYMDVAKIIYHRLPSSLADPIRNVLEPLFRKKINNVSNSVELEKTLHEKLFAPEIIQANDYLDVFDNNDKLVSIGLDWDFSNYDLLIQIKKKCNFKFISCFYDAIPITHPHLVHSDYFGKVFSLHLYKLIHLSDKVFCISDYSREMLIKIIKENEIETTAQLKTIHLGSNLKDLHPKNEALPSTNRQYILYVSTIEARKNHVFLLHVWNELLNIYGENTPELILVGMHGWGNKDFFDLYNKSPLLKKYVKIENSVSDDELTSLYIGSKFCVFPSIVEGWGLGAAEALSYGKVCIISDSAALQEATQGLMPSLSLNVDSWVKQVCFLTDNTVELSKLEKTVRDKFISRDWNSFSEDFHHFIENEK